MSNDAIKKSNLKTHFFYPVIATVVGGLILLFIQFCFPDFSPKQESVSTDPKQNEEKYTKEPFSYYSWSYQRIGFYKKFILFRKWKPVYNIQMKIGYIGEKPENIDVFIPINGRILDIAIPPNIESRTVQKNNDYNNYLSISFQNIKPGNIITFSFHVINDTEGEPIKKDLVNVYNGKTKPLDWNYFDYKFNVRNEGYLKYLFK